jgi:hypothetical protein
MSRIGLLLSIYLGASTVALAAPEPLADMSWDLPRQPRTDKPVKVNVSVKPKAGAGMAKLRLRLNGGLKVKHRKDYQYGADASGPFADLGEYPMAAGQEWKDNFDLEIPAGYYGVVTLGPATCQASTDQRSMSEVFTASFNPGDRGWVGFDGVDLLDALLISTSLNCHCLEDLSSSNHAFPYLDSGGCP